AGFATGDVQSHNPTADRGPERNIDLIFEVRSGFRLFVHRTSSGTTASKHSGENIAEASSSAGAGSSPPAAFKQIGKIETAKIELCALATSPLGATKSAVIAHSRRPTSARVSFRGRWIDVVRIEADLVVHLAFFRIA